MKSGHCPVWRRGRTTLHSATRILMIAVLPLPLIACGKREMSPTPEQFHSEQQQSTYGPTSDWRLSNATWSRSTQKCAVGPICFAGKSGVVIHYARRRRISHSSSPIMPKAMHTLPSGVKGAASLFDTIRQRPDAYIAARQHCMIIYQDGGAADARSLGPCSPTPAAAITSGSCLYHERHSGKSTALMPKIVPRVASDRSLC